MVSPKSPTSRAFAMRSSGTASFSSISRSREIEENDAVPEDLIAKAREVGLFGLTIPEEYGGSGLDLAGKCAIEEEMGKTNYGFATLIGNHTGISSTGIAALCTDYPKRKYLQRIAA